MYRYRDPFEDFEEFLKKLFSLWMNALKARQNLDITVTSDLNFRQCINSERESATKGEDGDFRNILINGQEIKAVISSDNFLVIKQDNDIFIGISVSEELGKKVLKVTGLDFQVTSPYNYNPQGQQGIKTEYLIKLMGKMGCNIRTKNPTNRLRRKLFSVLKREGLLSEINPKGGECYRGQRHYDFEFKLIEKLETEGDFQNNLNHYLNKIKGDNVRETEYEEPENADDWYVNRPDIERACYEKINLLELIRIKGSLGMGKTWLLRRLINYAKSKGYLTIKIDLNEPDSSVFKSLKSFYTWFCEKVIINLDIEALHINPYTEYYNNYLDSNTNTTHYFQKHLLKILLKHNQSKLLLALDNVERLFNFPDEIVENVSRLWRSWNDNKTTTIWQNIMMIVSYSTMDYPDSNIDSSPFKNIGHEVNLLDWTINQIRVVIQRYNIALDTQQINDLIFLIGGHPYLITKAIEYFHESQKNVSDLVKIQDNILLYIYDYRPFEKYLEQVIEHLENIPELSDIYYGILQQDLKKNIDRTNKFHLNAMGLIKIEKGQILPKYPLYQKYFSDYLNNNTNANESLEAKKSTQAITSFPGKVKIEFCRRLGKSWLYLADYFEIPEYDRDRFQQGSECQEILEWLQERERLNDLKSALDYINRQDLIGLLGN